MPDYISTDPQWKKPAGDAQRYRWDGSGWSPIGAQTAAAAPTPAFPTWADRAGVDNPMGRGALDFAEGMAAVVPQVVFGGGDVLRRLTGQPSVMQAPEVQRAMRAPASAMGTAGNLAPMAVPLVRALAVAPVATAAAMGTSYAAGQAVRPVAEAGARGAGLEPTQVDAAGDMGEFAGATLGGMMAPSALARLRARNPITVERRAVEHAVSRGLPVDVGTATGNRVAAGAQWLADRTLGGAAIATRADARTRQAYAREWEREAARTGVAAPTDPFAVGARAQQAQAQARDAIGRGYGVAAEQIQARMGGRDTSARGAGTQATQALTSAVRELRQQAERAYDEAFTQMQAARVPVTVGTTPGQAPRPSGVLDAAGRPVMTGGTGPQPVVETVETPVDITDLKASRVVQELWSDLNELPMAMKNASQAYASLHKLLNGPDVVSARAAERARSGLLDVAREAASADVRNINQGNAARLATMLRERIDQAVSTHAGPDALAALNAGRSTHAAKMQVADVLQRFSDEGVQAFNKLTWTDDRGVGLLEQVAKVAPQAMPQLGRTWLSQAVGKFADDGVVNLDKATALRAAYARLGDDTKALMFRSPSIRRQVDAWFAQLPQGQAAAGPPLATEPAAVARQLLGARDSHAAQLQALAKIAPDVPPMLMRAAMDDVAAEFAKTRKPTLEDLSMFRTWFNSLGPRTLEIVAPDPAFRRDLDYLTRVMQRVSDNPNRSGTGFMAALLAQVQQLVADPVTGVAAQGAGAALSAMLRSPRLVRALVKGASMPNTPDAAKYAGVVLQMLKADRNATTSEEQK
jgi:hypothetical protein